MNLAVAKLVDGVVATLARHVLPEVQDRFARAQLFAALDVLRNLRNRIDERADLFQVESRSATRALEDAADRLGGEAGAAVRTLLAAVPAEPPAQRAAALRQALVQALLDLERVPDGQAEPARALLLRHLAEQAQREQDLLVYPLLDRVLKG